MCVYANVIIHICTVDGITHITHTHHPLSHTHHPLKHTHARTHTHAHLADCATAFFLSLVALVALSASWWPIFSRRGGWGILKEGPALGKTSVSSRKGVPSIVPHVMRGEASTPEEGGGREGGREEERREGERGIEGGRERGREGGKEGERG